MRAGIFAVLILADVAPEFIAFQLFEEGEAAATAHASVGKILRARRIGAGLLHTAEGEETAHCGLLPCRHDAHCRFPAPGKGSAHSEKRGEQADFRSVAHAL